MNLNDGNKAIILHIFKPVLTILGARASPSERMHFEIIYSPNKT